MNDLIIKQKSKRNPHKTLNEHNVSGIRASACVSFINYVEV